MNDTTPIDDGDFASESPRRRVRRLRLEMLFNEHGGPAAVAAETGTPKSHFSALRKARRGIGDDLAEKLEKTFGLEAGWMDRPLGGPLDGQRSQITLESADDTSEPAYVIEYVSARGSCGGGATNWDAGKVYKLVKEASWFRRYNVRPEDLITVFADGDSMERFIVDGDMVFFDKTRTKPRSGEIFLVEHPDGLRIKRLRREIDGTWVLESDSPDKRRYPDERIPPEQTDLLVIRGAFVYRQGG